MKVIKIGILQFLKRSLRSMLAYFFLLFFVGLALLITCDNIIANDLEKNGKVTVGQYVRSNFYKGWTYYFMFNIDNVRYISSGRNSPKDFEGKIGEFYKVRYSEKYKGYIEAQYDQKVTDTAAILKAGFTMNDILLRNHSVKLEEYKFRTRILLPLGIVKE